MIEVGSFLYILLVFEDIVVLKRCVWEKIGLTPRLQMYRDRRLGRRAEISDGRCGRNP